MNKSFFNNFYLLTKLTTTLILFFAVMFLGYLLVKSYKVNNEESYIITIDDKINALSQTIETTCLGGIKFDEIYPKKYIMPIGHPT